MLQAIKRHLYEQVRCTRHNLLHLRVFSVSHRNGLWHVRSRDGAEMVFPYYPYLSFHDIEGYLQQGNWKIEPGTTVLDVGGCYGEFALYASQCVGPAGRVLMLEPDADNIAIAKRNFELNGSPKNLEIVPAGLWKEKTTLCFNIGQGPMTSVTGVGEALAGSKIVEIAVESLPTLIERYTLDRIDFVKMDIEGAEMEAIEGAAKLPPQVKPRYAIASYHIVSGRRTADLLPAEFEKIGYKSRIGNERHLTTWARPAGSGPL